MIELLFTTSNLPVSELIRRVTNEPVSHVAIRFYSFIIHASFNGVEILPYSVFLQKNQVIYKLPLHGYAPQIVNTIGKHYNKPYDYLGILYLCLRYLFPRVVPKQNLWQTTGMFLCTEFVTTILNQAEDSMITPYKLYLKLR